MKLWVFGVIATLLMAAVVYADCSETIINGKKVTCCCVGDGCWCK